MTKAATDDLSQEAVKTLVQESGLRHVAIIMDGNRRWAEARHLPKMLGHQQGVKALKALVRHCGEIGLEALTVYAFSTENWQRGEEEVGYLMSLFAKALLEELKDMARNNVRLKFIGDIAGLSPSLQEIIVDAECQLADNTGLRFQVATNYGSRAEMVHCVRRLLKEVQAGKLSPESIDEEAIAQYLYTAGLPTLDLLIRTGGESRLSNYLLWQAAYAEIYITQTLWPDFSPEAFNQALIEFSTRQRRFGK